MNTRFRRIILLIFVAFIGGCGSEQGAVESLTVITSENLSGLVDVQWMLEEMTIDGDNYQLTGERPLVEFERDGKVSGFASVNRFFGSMQIDDAGKVKWSNAFGATRMAGPEERMEQESVFLEILAKTDQLSIKGERLYAQSPEGRVKLVFYVPVE